MSGAIEGFAESLERFEVQEQVEDAMHESGRFVRSVSTETRRQAQTPEARHLAQDVRHGADVVGAKATDAAHTVQDAADTVRHKAEDAAQYVEHQWDELKESAAHGAQRVQEAAHVTAQETRQRGRLVAESGRRAKKAPGNVLRDARQAVDAWKGGMMAGMGLVAVAGLVGLAAFVVLTIAMVTWLNGLVGAPGGTFIVALLYAVAAGGALLGARGARRKGRKEAKQHMHEARVEVAAVGRPLREAVARHRVTRSQRPTRRADVGRVEADETAYQRAARRTASTGTGEEELASSIDEDHQNWNRR